MRARAEAGQPHERLGDFLPSAGTLTENCTVPERSLTISCCSVISSGRNRRTSGSSPSPPNASDSVAERNRQPSSGSNVSPASKLPVPSMAHYLAP